VTSIPSAASGIAAETRLAVGATVKRAVLRIDAKTSASCSLPAAAASLAPWRAASGRSAIDAQPGGSTSRPAGRADRGARRAGGGRHGARCGWHSIATA
jgi:hypothetical protein